MVLSKRRGRDRRRQVAARTFVARRSAGEFRLERGGQRSTARAPKSSSSGCGVGSTSGDGPGCVLSCDLIPGSGALASQPGEVSRLGLMTAVSGALVID